MATEDWKEIASRKQKSNFEKIPSEWRLPTTITDGISLNSDEGVLAIPTSCNVLTEREIELTENYDAFTLLQKISARQARYYPLRFNSNPHSIQIAVMKWL
jgi:amidase